MDPPPCTARSVSLYSHSEATTWHSPWLPLEIANVTCVVPLQCYCGASIVQAHGREVVYVNEDCDTVNGKGFLGEWRQGRNSRFASSLIKVLYFNKAWQSFTRPLLGANSLASPVSILSHRSFIFPISRSNLLCSMHEQCPSK